jgi:hypothetical protein
MQSDSSDKENDDVAEFPEVSDPVPAKFLTSKMGHKLLLDPFNYVYEKEKELKDDKCRWRCQRKRSKIFPRYNFCNFCCADQADHVAVAYFGQFLCSNLPRL